MKWTRDEFVIDTNPSRLDLHTIQRFLVEDSYWAKTRTPEQTRTAIDNSICFGMYHEETIVGFARVVSDKTTFAYLGDVFILDEYRGRGLGKWLMEAILSHTELQGLRRWILATRDAHELYRKYGFAELKYPERWMELHSPDAY
ncbi:MAG: GNAT family N-acetyltransferase [Pyrinomonadaceae bacterium]